MMSLGSSVSVREVEVTDEFVDWWSTLTIEQQEAVTDRVDVLALGGLSVERFVEEVGEAG